MSSILNYTLMGLEDSCTRCVLGVLAIIFIYYILKVVKIWRITRLDFRHVDKKENLLKFLSEYRFTKYIIGEYTRTICFKDRAEQRKTSEFASDYLNLASLLVAAKVNVNAMGAAAGILVGIGVLGTFIGLTIGVFQIDLSDIQNNPNKLINGVNGLIAGMKTAFLTSVAGMLLSTIYTLAEKHCLNILSKKCVTISDLLDKEFYLSDLEKQEISSERQKNDLISQVKVIVDELNKNFRTKDDRGNELTVGSMLNDVKTSCEKQRSMIEGVMEEFYDRLSDGLRESTLNPLIDKLNELSKAIQNPAASMASSIGEDLRSSVMLMIDELKNAVSNATTDKLEALGLQLDKASGALTMLPEMLQKMSEEMHGNITDLSLHVSNLQSQTAQAGANLVDQQAKLNYQSVQLMQEFKKNVQMASESMKNLEDLIKNFVALQKSTMNFTEKLNIASENIDSSVKTLKESQDDLVQTYADSIQETEETFKQICEALDHSKEISAEYANEFSRIRGALEKVFKEMHEGLNDYSETVKHGTDEFLKTYTQTVTKVAESLTNSFGELSDTLDKIREKENNG